MTDHYTDEATLLGHPRSITLAALVALDNARAACEHTQWHDECGLSIACLNCQARAVLDAVAPAIAARAKAEALRELADDMDGGQIEWDDLRYKTTDAPKGWVEECVLDAWESMLLWAPYLRLRADEIEGR